ncbi:MAG: imidazoleglycerol-phosphate dehydratase HisB [Bacillota bacterium]
MILAKRKALIERKTAETQIKLELFLDGEGRFKGKTGLGFFDHMLHLLVRHSGFDLAIEVQGDLEVDGHHTVEDLGICLGQALAAALGDKKGINRYGSAWVPMDEALVLTALDLSGRPFFNGQIALPCQQVGSFDTELVEEFWRAFTLHGGVTLHIKQETGKNTHHIIEAIFKSTGRALKEAVTLDPREKAVPSTKGIL